MKNIIVLAILAALGWYGYGKYKAAGDSTARTELAPVVAPSKTQDVATQAVPSQFTCDGRTHCSAMTSCAEATYFIQHCPNTEMDGDHDGVPCETQWCR
jgi:excalibur calcium-binding domain-containing protein